MKDCWKSSNGILHFAALRSEWQWFAKMWLNLNFKNTRNSEKFEILIESLLFVSGEPLKIKKIAATAGVKRRRERVGGKFAAQWFAEAKGLHSLKQMMRCSWWLARNSKLMDEFLKMKWSKAWAEHHWKHWRLSLIRGPLTRIRLTKLEAWIAVILWDIFASRTDWAAGNPADSAAGISD